MVGMNNQDAKLFRAAAPGRANQKFPDTGQGYDEFKISRNQRSLFQQINTPMYCIRRTLHIISRYLNDFFDKPSPIYYTTPFLSLSVEG
jgi:hypothetical protein